MDELTTPERQRDSGTGANDGYTDLEMIEKDNETLRERIAGLEAQLADADREAWNAAIDCVSAVIENVQYANQDAVAIAKESAEVARTFKK